MVDAVLFEFDGVVADTRAARCRALLDSLEHDGVTLNESEYLEHCAAMPVRASIRAAFALRQLAADETAIELAALRAERRFATLVETGLSLAVGASALIESLHGQTRLGIVSRASRRDIEATLAIAFLDHAFEFVIAQDDAYQPKPSPAPYVAALERLARRRTVTARNVIALEDGPVGIRSAKSAGLRCAVVGALPVHLAVDADALIPSLVGQTVASLDAITTSAHAAER
jgi:HAD superfamily hydrolase (TIGR01509 family)